MDVRDLEAGGLKVGVAAIPWQPYELAERACGVVDRIASALGIRDVALVAVHAARAGQRTAVCGLDRVAEALARRRFADDAGVDRLATRGERREDRRGPV